jgi:ferrous iron transport protein A
MPEALKRSDAVVEKSDPAVRESFPLALAGPGRELVLDHVQAGRRLQHRLAEMGLRPGARFRVLTRGQRGPLIVSIGETRLALGHGMVPRVYVRNANE